MHGTLNCILFHESPESPSIIDWAPSTPPHPYDAELFHELNVERYELAKTGRLLFNHPTETHDDRFWAASLSVFATTNTPLLNRPLVK